MERTYKIQIPANSKVGIIYSQFDKESNSIIIKADITKNITPKDGDILIDSFGSTFIYNGCKNNRCYDAYIGESIRSDFVHIGPFKDCFTPIKGCRYATNKEANNFLNKIENVLGQRWNAKEKKLKDIRFIPKKNQLYYYIGIVGNNLSVILTIFNNSSSDQFRIANSNCFKNETIATNKLNKLINDIKNERE